MSEGRMSKGRMRGVGGGEGGGRTSRCRCRRLERCEGREDSPGKENPFPPRGWSSKKGPQRGDSKGGIIYLAVISLPGLDTVAVAWPNTQATMLAGWLAHRWG